uniref:Arrestin domain-containing protein 3-like n=1 Tax=Gouania willdenowi TaxID=441366 RepID=A0A8C5IBR7_GOUWI
MLGSSFQNFVFNFNNMNERNTVCSGDLLMGNISFDLTKKTKITSISIALSGKAYVYWSTGSSKNRRTHSARLTFFNFNNVLLQENGAVADSTTLLAGTHLYPFSCQFPHGDFPSTFHSSNGHIVYKMKVAINRPWHMAKSFETELNHVSQIDTNNPELQAPLLGSNTMTPSWLWCTSGPISLTARTEKKAFNFGERVKLFCEFNNATSYSLTPVVKLHQKITYYTINRGTKLLLIKKMSSVTGRVVSAHTSEHTQLAITIPTTGTLTISNCHILEVEYLVEVSTGQQTERKH